MKAWQLFYIPWIEPMWKNQKYPVSILMRNGKRLDRRNWIERLFFLVKSRYILSNSCVNRKTLQIFRNTYSNTVTATTVRNGILHPVKLGVKNTKPTRTSPQWTLSQLGVGDPVTALR